MEEKLYKLKKDVDTLFAVKCPACRSDMLKVYIPELGFNVDLCIDGCGGIFFDNRELEQIRTPDINVSELLNLLKDKEFITTDQNSIRRCGCCNSKMLKIGAGSTRVEVDVCPNCGGKFLDNGELEQIRDSYIGVYEKSIIQYALLHPKSFSVVCSEIIKNTDAK